ncbi:MAG: GtrA family protein, partial [Bryobacteraceae bacterium]
FIAVGLLGALSHVTVLAVLLQVSGGRFLRAQAGATLVAMTVNFTLNNVLTYRQNKLAGWRFLRGLFTFYVACAIGAAANLAIAEELFTAGIPWWLAGLLGAVVGGVWNYAVTSTFTWKARG